jgi:hypothetical protein
MYSKIGSRGGGSDRRRTIDIQAHQQKAMSRPKGIKVSVQESELAFQLAIAQHLIF